MIITTASRRAAMRVHAVSSERAAAAGSTRGRSMQAAGRREDERQRARGREEPRTTGPRPQHAFFDRHRVAPRNLRTASMPAPIVPKLRKSAPTTCGRRGDVALPGRNGCGRVKCQVAGEQVVVNETVAERHRLRRTGRRRERGEGRTGASAGARRAIVWMRCVHAIEHQDQQGATGLVMTASAISGQPINSRRGRSCAAATIRQAGRRTGTAYPCRAAALASARSGAASQTWRRRGYRSSPKGGVPAQRTVANGDRCAGAG